MRHELSVRIGPAVPIAGTVGIHGPTGTGMQGAGVKIPQAAAVKAAVIGFDNVIQTPNGFTLRNGTKSKHEPIGPIGVNVIEVGKNVKGVGAAPKLHFANAKVPAANPILHLLAFQ